MGTWHWVPQLILAIAVGAVAGWFIRPRRRASVAAVTGGGEPNPYRVPMAIRIVAVPLGMVMLWLAAADLTSHRLSGFFDAVGQALLALYCFYCALRGRSVPWLESPEEATRFLERVMGRRSSPGGSSPTGSSSDGNSTSGTA
jgi:hypothetical protein